MAKTYRTLSGAEKALSKMRRKDLKRECLVRGMDFRECSESSDLQLQSFFIKAFEIKPVATFLTEYDRWLENFLIKERGYKSKKQNWAFHPMLKMGFMDDGVYKDPESKEAMPKKIKQGKYKPEPKVKKPKRIKDSKLGIYKGTKKALTFELTEKKLPINDIVKKVIEIFPEALPKSIQIWYKKACKKFGVEPDKTKLKPIVKKVENDITLIIEI